jgi:hypothetical protein
MTPGSAAGCAGCTTSSTRSCVPKPSSGWCRPSATTTREPSSWTSSRSRRAAKGRSLHLPKVSAKSHTLGPDRDEPRGCTQPHALGPPAIRFGIAAAGTRGSARCGVPAGPGPRRVRARASHPDGAPQGRQAAADGARPGRGRGARRLPRVAPRQQVADVITGCVKRRLHRPRRRTERGRRPAAPTRRRATPDSNFVIGRCWRPRALPRPPETGAARHGHPLSTRGRIPAAVSDAVQSEGPMPSQSGASRAPSVRRRAGRGFSAQVVVADSVRGPGRAGVERPASRLAAGSWAAGPGW